MIELNKKDDPVPEAKLSATLILAREGAQGIECLLLRRNPDLRVMGGAWVFPGGKVDETDGGSDDYSRSVSAVLREIQEEASLHVPGRELVYFSRWLTPEIVKYRFDTRFFLAPHTGSKLPVVDGDEIVDFQWIPADRAVLLQNEGELVVAPPTLVSLIDVARYPDLPTLWDAVGQREPPFFFPKIRAAGEDRVFLYPGDHGYEEGNPALGDPCHRTTLTMGRYEYQRSFNWPARSA